MYKLQIAVGIHGRIVVLEKFPDDEKHAGLNEMLDELDEWYTDEPPGIYVATIEIANIDPDDGSRECAWLHIQSLEPLMVAGVPPVSAEFVDLGDQNENES